MLASSPLIDATIRRLEEICDNEATVMAIVRDGQRHLAPDGTDRIHADDVLVLQGDPLALRPLLQQRGLMSIGDDDVSQASLMSDDVILVEATVMPKAPIEGRSMRRLRMHETYGVNLLAMARKGQAPEARLARVRFQVGDVLLLQGQRTTLQKILPMLGCLPLAERGFNRLKTKTSWLPLVIFASGRAGDGSRPAARPDRLRRCRARHGAHRRAAGAGCLCGDRVAGHHTAREPDPHRSSPRDIRRHRADSRMVSRQSRAIFPYGPCSP